MTNQQLTIFAVYHKEFAVPDCDFIRPIQVGRKFSKVDLGFLSDDVDENIADKNQTYGELTALYWLWKHIDDFKADYIGFCHYRRYFVEQRVIIKNKLFFKKVKLDPSNLYLVPLNAATLAEVSSEKLRDQIVQLLSNAEILLPKKLHHELRPGFPLSIKDHYIYHHIKEDWHLMREATIKLYPELETAFDKLFEGSNEMFCYNMMVSSKSIFAAYCAWLFPIINELEKTVKLSEYPYQRRIFGFFSERLLNLYVFSKNLKVAELPVVFIAD